MSVKTSAGMCCILFTKLVLFISKQIILQTRIGERPSQPNGVTRQFLRTLLHMKRQCPHIMGTGNTNVSTHDQFCSYRSNSIHLVHPRS
jgi:hypothetical protein